ncbi:MAG: 2-isopropylmalate synthase [Lentisphaeria bacterium]|nr:2-isopropylmalate synthase [Lentisphaeria bacterium]
MNHFSYSRPPVIENPNREWPDKQITNAPRWCAVDLRDGNQALPNPMTPEQKLTYFKTLCEIGFKEIEVGFPSAAADEFDFMRQLIEENLIPDDVVVSVLTQARPHLVQRTMESLKGVKNAVVHFYIASSDLHRSFVFGLERDAQLELARTTTLQIRELADQMPESNIGLEFSPEEFTDTDLDYSIAMCDIVMENWQPKPDEKVILNLPATVERRFPNEYADMIECFKRQLKNSSQACISAHVHNDMGMGVAATMLSLKAGVDRVEGTLLGHGERTGNVDLITCALNLDYLGVTSRLDFSDLPRIVKLVDSITGIDTHARAPYSGQLVFTAFSGSHQDAIYKGLTNRKKLEDYFGGWKIPYLHIAPSQIGRDFEKFIRINSQSGKGGIAHIMEFEHNIKLPRWMQIEFAKKVQQFADKEQRELESSELLNIFKDQYFPTEPIELINYWPRPSEDSPEHINGEIEVLVAGETICASAEGNGPISAFVHAIKQVDQVPSFTLDEYTEGTCGKGADAEGICFMRIITESDSSHTGVGRGSNLDQAAARAAISAINNILNK